MTGLQARKWTHRNVRAGLCMALLVCCLNAAAASNDWLVGIWQLAEDKKNPGVTDDFMDFDANGAVQLRDSKKVYASCTYLPGESAVVLRCVVRGKEKALTFRVGSGHKTLTSPQGDIYKKLH